MHWSLGSFCSSVKKRKKREGEQDWEREWKEEIEGEEGEEERRSEKKREEKKEDTSQGHICLWIPVLPLTRTMTYKAPEFH
jgi:hypothetical protein